MHSVSENSSPNDSRVRVFLVDDNPVGLRLMERSLRFRDDEEFEVIGTASNGADALDKIKALVPDLVITDVEMPLVDGIQLTKKVGQFLPQAIVVVAADTYSTEEAERSVRAGARTYCDKSSLVMSLADIFSTSSELYDASASSSMDHDWAEEFFGGLLSSSDAGLAICDGSFRYKFINAALAAMNGVPSRDHLGKTFRDVLGDASPVTEANCRKVFESGKALLNYEVVAKLPGRIGKGRWIVDYFPMMDTHAKVTHVAIVVLEEKAADSHGIDPSLTESGGINGFSVLRSWKEVARYLGTSVRTAQRWERELELPVRRLSTQRGLSVISFRSDLDHWLLAAANRPRPILPLSTAPAPGAPEEFSQILRSWKEIGRYLAASPRAVQRWERTLGLPVRRIQLKSGAVVFAMRSDLDQWLTSRSQAAILGK